MCRRHDHGMGAQAISVAGNNRGALCYSVAWRLRFWLLAFRGGGFSTLRDTLSCWLSFRRSSRRELGGNGPAMRSARSAIARPRRRGAHQHGRCGEGITHRDPRAESARSVVALAARSSMRENPRDYARTCAGSRPVGAGARAPCARGASGCKRRRRAGTTASPSRSARAGVSGYSITACPRAASWFRLRDFRPHAAAIRARDNDTARHTGAIVVGRLQSGIPQPCSRKSMGLAARPGWIELQRSARCPRQRAVAPAARSTLRVVVLMRKLGFSDRDPHGFGVSRRPIEIKSPPPSWPPQNRSAPNNP